MQNPDQLKPELLAQRLFKVQFEPTNPYDSPATITVMAPNEHSARQRAMVMHRQGYTVTDLEAKLTARD